MTDLIFIDLNGMIGQPVFEPHYGCYNKYSNSDSLIQSMNYYGVDYALTSHYQALFGNPMHFNELLLTEIRGKKRLFPCWYVLPHHTSEMLAPEKLIGKLISKGIKAVRIPFGEYNQCFNEWILSELFELFEENGILTIFQLPTMGVPVPQRGDYFFDKLYSICKAHSSLNVVCAGRLRSFYPVMEKCENLLFSLEYDPHPNLIEELCEKFGANRVLFGTPYNENVREISGMTMMMISYAEISDYEKSLIAGGNLAKLLGLELKSIKNIDGKKKFKTIIDGKKLKYKIYDIHAHIGSWPSEYKPCTDLECLLDCMKKVGVEKVCINSTEAVVGGNHYIGNKYIASIIKRYPESFTGFLVINPHFKDCRKYIEENVKNSGFQGIKIHPRLHRCNIIDDRYIPVWETSEEYKIPVLCHTGEGQAYSDPKQFSDIAPKHPDGLFILGHSGETFEGIKICIQIVNEYENLYLDISGWGFMKKGYLEFLVERVDNNKILFGSDFSWIDLRYAIAVVVFSEIGEREKKLILSENALRLFNRLRINNIT